ncbi:beta-galactosidase [Microbacterium oleivorans]|uniref:beta-galactosidase n=1 Tax=Microbacterium oleivorans TaxID=273677 RepID=UPI00203B3C1D|nr:beta-galactosidase [Microbacterium oleivorans]MCM3694989.1 beta-galactosidase [Microbacterium oleivorans]
MRAADRPADLRRDLVVSGEIHYFRLDPAEWADRLDTALRTGVTAIATYVPWLVHELPDGSFDFGERHPHLDLSRFLGLCAERGLAVIARPGPFVMAELKNEGLGYSVLRRHPEIRAIGWDGQTRPEMIVDYLHPAYLAAADGWFDAVIPLLAARTVHRGGPIVGIQLDNEIGMLPWVTNSPDLSDRTVAELVQSLIAASSSAAVQARYSVGATSFHVADPETWGPALRSPVEEQVLALHRDLGRFTRDRYARYVQHLRDGVRARGVGDDVPLLVNVHGCWGERATMFPLGISQLHRTWSDGATFPGTDIYIGDLDLDTLPGLWASTAFLAATCREDQPYGVLEFEVGSGDYGEALDVTTGPEAAGLKLQLAIAQGSSLVNYYLLAGGRNPALFEPVGDGNDRIAFTGERHGFAAPIRPEGDLAPWFAETVHLTEAVTDAAELLRAARPERPPVTIGFVVDHYMTEYRYPGSPREAEFVAELERFRGSGPREIMTRALAVGGYAPDATLIDGPDAFADLPNDRVLALAPTPFLDDDVQGALADWVRRGGRLLLSGPIPQHDMEGRPATALLDALGLDAGVRDESGLHAMTYAATPGRTPFVAPTATADGPVWRGAEVAVGFAQPLIARRADAGVTPLAHLARSGEPCVVEVPLGAGRVVVAATDLPCLPEIWDALLARLDAAPAVRVTSDSRGVVVVPCRTSDGVELVHVINVSPWDTSVALERDGRPLTDEPFALARRSGTWLVRHPGETAARLAYRGLRD